jgi:large subunit ribosomal protein L31
MLTEEYRQMTTLVKIKYLAIMCLLSNMAKADIHPVYFPKATVVCGCGNSFTVGATREKIEVEICSKCHPFYTGEEKLIDTAGKVEKFKARRAKAAAAPKKLKKVRVRKPQESVVKKIK